MIIIRKDTVWGPGVKILTDDVQIAEGATLIISPGAQIFGNGHKIESYGSLTAKGTASIPIFFDNVRLGLSDDIESISNITIDRAHINKSNLSAISNGVWGSIKLTNSTITGLTNEIYNGYDKYAGRSTFSNNVFLDSHGIYSSSSTSPIISRNIFDRYDSVDIGYGLVEEGTPITSSSKWNWSAFIRQCLLGSGESCD